MDERVFKGNPTLETERLILRKLTMDDAEDIFAYASDPEVTAYMLWDTHATIDDSKNFIRFTLDRYEKDEAGEWGIILKETGRLIGCAGFVRTDMKNRRTEIGYVLGKPYWGKGIVPEAAGRMLKFAFEDMGLNRIECYHLLPNEKSGRVMQKLGMTYEGTAREKVLVKGRFWDVKQYAILKEDWENQ
jgi:ribosomal-protein-alanine N-acetyltransferase